MKHLLYLLLFISFTVKAQLPNENKIRLIDNWEFLQSDVGNIWETLRPVKQGEAEAVPIWEKVTLPHCFNSEDAVSPTVNYYQGPGWYRNKLSIANPYPNGRTILHFEGAGQKTQVYIFNEKVGEHIGGYDEWTIDITNAVNDFQKNPLYKGRFKSKIPLSIRCDNSRDAEMIPSNLSDFTLYGGLYRYVNLVYVPTLSLKNLYAKTELDKKNQKGTLSISTEFYNPLDQNDAELLVQIIQPNGKKLAEKKIKINDLSKVTDIFSFSVSKPQLWSPNKPNLYTCNISVISEQTTISYIQKVGFRHFEFAENGPFYLNGERLLLKGTHRHEDHAGVGGAMTEEMMRKEMILIKEMGANFIRLGHYQQSDIILNLCDSLGILVWEEIPWCRGGLGGETYKEQARRMLTNQIMQHRHHPSIILWGLGNENDWPNDFEEYSNDLLKGYIGNDKVAAEKIRVFMKELHELSHQLDNTRLTAIRRCDFCRDIVDVYSPSIWAGWYRGIFTDYKKVSEHEMKRVKRFFHAEWGGDSHARRHTEEPFRYLDAIEAATRADERAGDASLYGGKARASKDGEWTETYICKLIDWHLKEQENMPNLTGSAYWVFKDFATPLRPENPVPYVNQKGVVERDLTPKEAYYVFQSYWTEKPMIRIYGHTWKRRWQRENKENEVCVYSNCSEVELFVNGKSAGKKKRNSQNYPAAGLNWNLIFAEGNNVLIAVGNKGKEVVRDTVTFNYQTKKWGNPTEIIVSTKQLSTDIVEIEAELVDNKGVYCLDSRNQFEFSLIGDGNLIENQGTSIGSRKLEAFNGRAIIRVQLNKGESIVAIKSENCKTQFITVKP